jgi:hypothetical protein
MIVQCNATHNIKTMLNLPRKINKMGHINTNKVEQNKVGHTTLEYLFPS